jgi:hypothetical protein
MRLHDNCEFAGNLDLDRILFTWSLMLADCRSCPDSFIRIMEVAAGNGSINEREPWFLKVCQSPTH